PRRRAGPRRRRCAARAGTAKTRERRRAGSTRTGGRERSFARSVALVAARVVELAIRGIALQDPAVVAEVLAAVNTFVAEIVAFAVFEDVDDAVTAVRELAVRATGIGHRVGVLGAVVAFLTDLEDTVAADRLPDALGEI